MHKRLCFDSVRMSVCNNSKTDRQIFIVSKMEQGSCFLVFILCICYSWLSLLMNIVCINSIHYKFVSGPIYVYLTVYYI